MPARANNHEQRGRDQLDTVDLTRLREQAGCLTLDEMRQVDEALALVLDL